MGKIKPITHGALYRDVSQTNSHGEVVRIKSVWVDENCNTQVQLFRENTNVANPTSETVDLPSFLEAVDNEIIRVNSDHEAWAYRNR
jgi:hypothetical protein